jgi:hypothetical protein
MKGRYILNFQGDNLYETFTHDIIRFMRVAYRWRERRDGGVSYNTTGKKINRRSKKRRLRNINPSTLQ